MTDQQGPAEARAEEDAEALYQLDLMSRHEVKRRRVSAAQDLTPERRRFAEFYVGAARFSATKAAKLAMVNERTARSWRDRYDVRRYCACLIAEAAAKLMITKDAIVTEIGRVAFSDVATLITAIEDITADLAASLPEGEDAKRQPITAGQIVERIGPEHSTAIKKIKFGVSHHERFEWVDNPGTGKAEWRAVERTPVPFIDEVELHDKLAALKTLAPWFGLIEKSLTDQDDEGEGGWQGVLIAAPEDAGNVE